RKPQNHVLAEGHIAADQTRQLIEVRLVDPDDGAAFPLGMSRQRRPSFLDPRPDGRLVALAGSLDRPLRAPAAGPQHAADVGRVVTHAELLADDGRHTLRRPDVAATSVWPSVSRRGSRGLLPFRPPNHR